MDLEITILTEQNQRQVSQDIPYMWNKKKNYKNELIYKTETDSNIEYKFMNTEREREEG